MSCVPYRLFVCLCTPASGGESEHSVAERGQDVPLAAQILICDIHPIIYDVKVYTKPLCIVEKL